MFGIPWIPFWDICDKDGKFYSDCKLLNVIHFNGFFRRECVSVKFDESDRAASVIL